MALAPEVVLKHPLIRPCCLGRELPDQTRLARLVTHRCRAKRSEADQAVCCGRNFRPKHGRAALGYTQFCEHYRRWKGSQRRSMRQTHYAGEKLFYRLLRPDRADCRPTYRRKIRYAAIFVATLGASNYTYIEACAGQDQQSWLMGKQPLPELFRRRTDLIACPIISKARFGQSRQV